MDSWEIALRYLKILSEQPFRLLLFPLLGAFFVGLFAVLLDRPSRRWGKRIGAGLLLLTALLGGVKMALSRASLFDDAYISFRYARNLVEGHGLVFNVGERVEGYTNFLWTVWLALLMKLGAGDAPEVALVLNVLCFVGNLVTTFYLSQALRDPRAKGLSAFPFSVPLLAVQGVFVDYATSGMEAGLACLLVQCGLLAFVRAKRPIGIALSSSCFILATMTRPDHALFYAWGSLLLLVSLVGGVRRAPTARRGSTWKRGRQFLVAWALPFVPYVIYVAAKYNYYGQLVPNTYFAKSAEDSYFSQGFLYAESFYLGTHFWWVTLLFLAGTTLRSRSRAQWRFRWFAVGTFVLFNFYVMKVGGDFMYGRFYVTLIPLLLLGAELLVRRALHRAQSASPAQKAWTYLLCGSFLSTAHGVHLIRPQKIEWGLTDESTFYPLSSLFPAVVEHGNFRIGDELYKLHAAGLSPLLATSGIGMLGYRSHLPIVDIVGLVDAEVAHSKLEKRGRPGHEKLASKAYIERRNPHLIRGETYIPWAYRRLTALTFGGADTGRRWDIYHYDRKVMGQIRKLLPETKFRSFESYFDRYVRHAKKKLPAKFERDYRFFRRYYFDHNDDPQRKRKLERLYLRYEKGKKARRARKAQK